MKADFVERLTSRGKKSITTLPFSPEMRWQSLFHSWFGCLGSSPNTLPITKNSGRARTLAFLSQLTNYFAPMPEFFFHFTFGTARNSSKLTYTHTTTRFARETGLASGLLKQQKWFDDGRAETTPGFEALQRTLIEFRLCCYCFREVGELSIQAKELSWSGESINYGTGFVGVVQFPDCWMDFCVFRKMRAFRKIPAFRNFCAFRKISVLQFLQIVCQCFENEIKFRKTLALRA